LLGESEAERRLGGIDFMVGFAQLPQAELAVEAVFEDMEIKRKVFRSLDQALPAHAVLATNTSYLDINEIAAVTKRPEKVLGLHFFSPAHVMRLLEIVRGRSTSDEALASAFNVAKKLNKIPVLAGVCDGFIGNRILARYREQADILLMDGALPWAIDAAMVDFGMAMGPYEVQDLAGLDIAYAQRKRKAASRDPNRRYIPIADRLVEEGRLGRKTGAGWYRYADGRPLPDPFVENLILEQARLAKVNRRQISDEEIRIRLTVAMINEAADILHEGIAASASDIDLVLVHGYGFPRWRGGLMFYADTVGTAAVLDRVEAFAREDPVIWKPSPLLKKLAETKGTFGSWRRD
jgi:3-hydroxyacyl-CoA dehydrogenase